MPSLYSGEDPENAIRKSLSTRSIVRARSTLVVTMGPVPCGAATVGSNPTVCICECTARESSLIRDLMLAGGVHATKPGDASGLNGGAMLFAMLGAPYEI